MTKSIRKIALASALALGTALPASAATLGGTFDVQVVRITGADTAESKATLDNFNAALGSSGDQDTFTFTGDLDFSATNSNDSTTILQWLQTSAGGVIDGLDAGVGALKLSQDDINNSTAITTFFYFTLKHLFMQDKFTVVHDDGIAIYDDGVRIGGREGPNSKATTIVEDFTGGTFGLLYVATNGNPSILKVDATPIPLPAGGVLLLTALSGLAIARRRKQA